MSTTTNPANFHPLYDTPQGLQQLEGMYARLRSKLTPTTPPSETMGAWADLRRELYIEPGLEGLTGPDATYHLIQDVPSYLGAAAEVLAGSGVDSFGVSHHKRPRAALRHMVKGWGWRYLRGTEGLADSLKAVCGSRAGSAQVAVFRAGRERFTLEFVRKANAAWEVNERGENPTAVFTALNLFLAEMYELRGWLEMAGKGAEARVMRDGLDEASERGRQVFLVGSQLKRKPKRSGRGY